MITVAYSHACVRAHSLPCMPGRACVLTGFSMHLSDSFCTVLVFESTNDSHTSMTKDVGPLCQFLGTRYAWPAPVPLVRAHAGSPSTRALAAGACPRGHARVRVRARMCMLPLDTEAIKEPSLGKPAIYWSMFRVHDAVQVHTLY